jgi:hypothetical protein
MRSTVKNSSVASVLAFAAITASASLAHASSFTPGNLIVSRSVYEGTAATVTVGQALPGTDAGAVADGTYPTVFQNASVDSSFGVTSPIFIDEINVSGTTATVVGTLAVPASDVVTSFSSKSELALNPSTDGHFVTFMAYASTINQLDVSNANTPGHIDPTNPVQFTAQRAVVRVDSLQNVSVTPVNTYSGNNGRAVIYDVADKQYILVGNAGNGGSPEPINIVNDTGVQVVAPNGGPETTVIGAQQGDAGAANGFQFGFAVQQLGLTADKSGKDDNFRGMGISNNTLFVTKGSGSNGINTLYQVGATGTLPTAVTGPTTQFSIVPGFPATLAKAAGARNPFGFWFADANTVYVADEGDGTAADAATSTIAGIEKWVQANGTWTNVYTLQQGLNLGVAYSVPGLASNLNPSPDGLRSLTGKLNGDGTATLYAVTSTISASGDQGADPNQLVTITDTVSFTTAAAASGESFTVLQTAPAGQVFRGVAFTPAPLPQTPAAPPVALVAVGAVLLGLGALLARSRGQAPRAAV